MAESAPQEQVDSHQETAKLKIKAKRDIFRFNGEITTAINLEHVTNIDLQGKRITFQFYNISRFVDMADEAAAANVYEVLLNTWSADVVE